MKETKNLEIAISATEPTIIIELQEHKKKMASPKSGQNLTNCIQFWYIQLQTIADGFFRFMKQNMSSLTYIRSAAILFTKEISKGPLGRTFK